MPSHSSTADPFPSRTRPRLAAAAVLLVLALGASTVSAEVEIISLRHRTVDQVMPVLRPMLEPGGALSGMNNQLIIRASAANIADLRRVLASIDTPLRRLLISVRQERAGAEQWREATVGGTVSGSVGGVPGRVVIGDDRRPGIGVSIENSRETVGEQLLHQVQAVEGAPALVQLGQTVNVPVRSVTSMPFGTVVQDGVVQREANTGVQVIARLSGDRVTLEIAPQREVPGPGGTVQSQRIVTTVGGRLGEWFELGGLSRQTSVQGGGLLSSGRGERDDARRVWVKVDELR